MLGPVLRGDRITLRPRLRDYAMVFVHHLQDPDVTKLLNTNKSAPTLEEELGYLDESSEDGSSIHWAIFFEGNCIGSVSIENIDSLHGHCNMGLFIGEPGLWGLGLGKDTAETVVEYMFNEYPIRHIRTDYFESNEASKHLLASLAFKVCGRYHEAFFSEGKYVDHVMMELSRENWLENIQEATEKDPE
jgi:RimJ/RimL family protein N-acetyltransferase